MKRKNWTSQRYISVFLSLLMALTLTGCGSKTNTHIDDSHEDIGVYINALNSINSNVSGSNSVQENNQEELRSLQNLRDGTFLSISITEIPISQGASTIDIKPALVSPLSSIDLIIRSNWFLERNGISIRLRNSGNNFFVKDNCLDVSDGEIEFRKCTLLDSNSNLEMRPLDNGAVVLTAKGTDKGGVFKCLGATPNQVDVGKLELTLDSCSLNNSVDPRFQWVITATQTPATTK
ncbi:TPA: hypothetical protein ACISYW_004820, partial [Salmonella enterica subsp. diarizonae serovar 61:l,v:z35]